jgi:hypothetical protein
MKTARNLLLLVSIVSSLTALYSIAVASMVMVSGLVIIIPVYIRLGIRNGEPKRVTLYLLGKATSPSPRFSAAAVALIFAGLAMGHMDVPDLQLHITATGIVISWLCYWNIRNDDRKGLQPACGAYR